MSCLEARRERGQLLPCCLRMAYKNPRIGLAVDHYTTRAQELLLTGDSSDQGPRIGHCRTDMEGAKFGRDRTLFR